MKPALVSIALLGSALACGPANPGDAGAPPTNGDATGSQPGSRDGVAVGSIGHTGDDAGEGEGEGAASEGEGDAAAGEGEGDVAVGEGEGEGDIPVRGGEGEGEGEVAVAHPLFVAVGYGGRRQSSVDGAVWSQEINDAQNGGDDDNLLRDVCFGDHTYLAVGGSHIGRMMRSTDGIHWESHVDQDGWLGGCAYGNGVFVAAGSSRSIRSVDGGVTWQDPTFHFVWQMRDVGFANGLFVATGDQGIFTSPDGVDWTQRDSHSVTRVAGAAPGFVVAGAGVRGFSSDGVSWTFTSSGARDVVWDGARFVVVGGGQVQTSSDGVQWDSRSINTAVDHVAAGNASYVGASWPNNLHRSTDGLSWSDDGDASTNPIEAMVYGE